MSKGKPKGNLLEKEPSYFKAADSYYYDKGSNSRLNKLANADAAKQQNKGPKYTLPTKLMTDPMFKPIFEFYVNYGVKKTDPLPTGEGPLEEPPPEVQQALLTSMTSVLNDLDSSVSIKVKGADIKKNIGFLAKKLQETEKLKWEYFKELETRLKSWQKNEKKLEQKAEKKKELEEVQATVREKAAIVNQCIFSFGGILEKQVTRIVIAMDISSATGPYLADLKEELTAFIEQDLQNLPFNLVAFSDEVTSWKPTIVESPSAADLASVAKFIKGLKCNAAVQPGYANFVKALEKVTEMEPSLVFWVASQVPNGARDKTDFASLLTDHFEPRASQRGRRGSEDEDGSENGDEDGEGEGDASPSSMQNGDGGEGSPSGSASSSIPPWQRQILDKSGTEVRVLSFDPEPPEEFMTFYTDVVQRCNGGNTTVSSDSRIRVSNRNALWSEISSDCKKAQKLRGMMKKLASAEGASEKLSSEIPEWRERLHIQIAIEKLFKFDLKKCREAMWRPVDPPPPPPVKPEKAGGKAAAKAKPPEKPPEAEPEKPASAAPPTAAPDTEAPSERATTAAPAGGGLAVPGGGMSSARPVSAPALPETLKGDGGKGLGDPNNVTATTTASPTSSPAKTPAETGGLAKRGGEAVAG
uniref:VWFA domain-containing protein n=1 Tax=Chromera velia CCMP2878 TaxID=1169474 RepID=A0A0G4GUG7_9ALVE|eukprot:Cvel_23412.t1-p1 / transcript=Cvel_23412.t1 / gene=Cvel_23412 / organism=Chromera_velia_CCMP2878 / gene_product=hypothetical protein / transcript_product=hypothetical protein / location=Cvel_scaffold2410:1589-6538(+) / protein_length=640 / sequence_SO=supercontig / SO=protein_coding / is_pseudo=false